MTDIRVRRPLWIQITSYSFAAALFAMSLSMSPSIN